MSSHALSLPNGTQPRLTERRMVSALAQSSARPLRLVAKELIADMIAREGAV